PTGITRGEAGACPPFGREILDPVTYVSETGSKYGVCLLFIIQISYLIFNADVSTNVYHNFE
ncbi:MAG: hypothetical protein ACK55I_13820, partial [bacterium]